MKEEGGRQKPHRGKEERQLGMHVAAQHAQR